MKKMLYSLITATMIFSATIACSNYEPATPVNAKEQNEGNQESGNKTHETQEEAQQNDNEEMKCIRIKIHNGKSLTATLAGNSSAQALAEFLEQGDITINMNDYANMEKVGYLGTDLPRNDEYITTEAGDIILYQGNQFVIYYDTNRWSLTRLGKIDDMTQEELKEALGDGNITVTLSINQETSSIR